MPLERSLDQAAVARASTVLGIHDALPQAKQVKPLIVPAEGMHYVFSNTSIPGVNTIPYPVGQMIAFVGVGVGDITRSTVLCNRLFRHSNTIMYYQVADDLRNLQSIANTIGEIKPSVVFMPPPADNRLRYGETRLALLDAIARYDHDNNVVAVGYETQGIVPINRVVHFSEQLNRLKRDGEACYPTQMNRNPFDDFTEDMDRALAIETMGLGVSGDFAEGFVLAQIRGGKIQTVPGPIAEFNFAELAGKYHKVYFLSPHADDDLAADATLIKLRQSGVEVVNVILNAGSADIKGVESLQERKNIRLAEAEKSAHVLGIQLLTMLPEEEERVSPEGKRYMHLIRDDRRQLLSAELQSGLTDAQAHGKSILVFMPHEQDQHVTHRKVLRVGNDVIVKLAPNGGIDPIYYRSPWITQTNAYVYYPEGEKAFPATPLGRTQALRERALAMVCSERLAGKGKAPVMGAGSAGAKHGNMVERVYIFKPSELR